ncbi:DinB family protein [Streptomyces sp. A012304]|uniref:DinB family protein n=1 Tax=Streptomyces sp. A012304 TaxID=375446 RepID=UPI002231AB92|nr:DinB family protein [Streptomyces sp. A012304]GKQ37044.1 DNA damage-inducible protein DinB [Streptomyces sp. A012304]
MNAPTNPGSRELLRWQSDLTWSLFEYHLERLEAEDFLWEPVAHCWTLRPDGAGGWVPDWADTEPDPVPLPTIGWLSWHLGWWLGVATDQLRGRTPRERADVRWPGPGEPAVAWLRGLREEWTAAVDALTDADLARPVAFPWPPDSGHTVAHLLAWAEAELMKNVAEMGQLRLLRVAGQRNGG